MDHTARKWTDDDLWQAIEHAHWAGEQDERRRVLRAAGDLFAAPSFERRARRSREDQIAYALSEMERVIRDHVPDARCQRACAVCVARIPVLRVEPAGRYLGPIEPSWPTLTMPGEGGR